jgi:hypothetical protein
MNVSYRRELIMPLNFVVSGERRFVVSVRMSWTSLVTKREPAF